MAIEKWFVIVDNQLCKKFDGEKDGRIEYEKFKKLNIANTLILAKSVEEHRRHK
jgi:hypothetical protein